MASGARRYLAPLHDFLRRRGERVGRKHGRCGQFVSADEPEISADDLQTGGERLRGMMIHHRQGHSDFIPLRCQGGNSFRSVACEQVFGIRFGSIRQDQLEFADADDAVHVGAF